MPSAPISNSSGCAVVSVLPGLSVLPFPVAVLDLSRGNDDARPLKEKNAATLLPGFGDGNVTVIEPPDTRAVVTRVEKSRVLAPLLLVTSASSVYKLPSVSLTVTSEVVGSMTTGTKIVFPMATVAGTLSVI